MDRNRNKEYRKEYQKHRFKDPYYRLLTRIYSQIYRVINNVTRNPRKGSINYLGIETNEQFINHIKERLALKYPHLSFPKDYGKGRLLEFNHIKSLLTAYQEGGEEAMIAAAHYTNVELELIEINRAAKKNRNFGKTKKFWQKEDEVLEIKDGLVKIKKYGRKDQEFILTFDVEYPNGKLLDFLKEYNITIKGTNSNSIQFVHKITGESLTVYKLLGISRHLRKIDPMDYSKNSMLAGRKPIINLDTGKTYSGPSEAGRDLNIHQVAIQNVLSGRQKKAGGYRWKRL